MEQNHINQFYDKEEYNNIKDNQPTSEKKDKQKNFEETKKTRITTLENTNSSQLLGKKIKRGKLFEINKNISISKNVFYDNDQILNQNLESKQNYIIQEELSILENLSVNHTCINPNKDKNNFSKIIPRLSNFSLKKNEKREKAIIQCGIMFLRSYFGLLDYRCQRHDYSLKSPNYEDIFIKNINDMKKFINRDIRDILSIENPINKKVIYDMIYKKKDDIFEALVILSFKEGYNSFIQNNRSIKINKYEFHLSHYSTFNDCIKEKKLPIIEELDEYEVEIIAKNLIKEIEEK